MQVNTVGVDKDQIDGLPLIAKCMESKPPPETINEVRGTSVQINDFTLIDLSSNIFGLTVCHNNVVLTQTVYG